MASKMNVVLKHNLIRATKPWLQLRVFNIDRTLYGVPEHYKKFYWLWKHGPQAPVHYVPIEEKFEMLENGEVVPVRDVPIPKLMPHNFDRVLTGGEGVVKGLTKGPKRWSSRFPKYWFPKFNTAVVYSEILDERIEALCTKRALRLIDESYGLDNYILKTPVPDLGTELAYKLRRRMLFAIADETLYPDNPAKKEELLNKYRKYLIPRDELEWFGLNLFEARLKQDLMEEEQENKNKFPLKTVYRKQFFDYLKSDEYKKLKEEGALEEDKQPSQFTKFIDNFIPFKKN